MNAEVNSTSWMRCTLLCRDTRTPLSRIPTPPTSSASWALKIRTNLHLNSPPTVPSISTESASLSATSSLPVALASVPALSPLHKADASPSPSQSRAKPLATVKRVANKNLDGKYHCSWEGCTRRSQDIFAKMRMEVSSQKCDVFVLFNRALLNEGLKLISALFFSSKHMDKHDRPYKCIAKGCETLPGFTYSGGLLRHEREVHGLYGGPKNPLHCPHPNCKRHTGNGLLPPREFERAPFGECTLPPQAT